MPKRLLQLLHAQPFIPFRVRCADGNQVNIFCPENVILTRRSLVVSFPQAPDGSIHEGTVHLDRNLIVRIEQLKSKGQPKSSAGL
jgi:hypothetical protein